MSVDEFFMTEIAKLSDTHFPGLASVSIMSFNFSLVFKIDLHPVPIFTLGVRFSVFCSIFGIFFVEVILGVDLEDI